MTTSIHKYTEQILPIMLAAILLVGSTAHAATTAVTTPSSAPTTAPASAASDQKTATPDDRAQEEANRKAQRDLIAQQKAQKLAAIKAEKDAEAQERARLQDALERQCVIKPVMTDDEITTCKTVWR